jgi:hypothetical protein
VVAHLLGRGLDVGPDEGRVRKQALKRVLAPVPIGVDPGSRLTRKDGRRTRFGRAVRVRVRVAAAAVDVMEEDEADDVGEKAERADDDDDPRVGDLGHRHEPLDALEEDREAKREEEDAVDEGA